MEHEHTPSHPGGIFCRCGKVVDPGTLRQVRFVGFHGAASTNPKVEEFWATGDAEVFSRP